MKKIATFILSLVILVAAHAETGIKGTVTDDRNGDPIIFCTLSIYEDGVYLRSTQTDADGLYILDHLTAGTYQLEINYVGYEAFRQNDIKVKEGKMKTIDVVLKDNSVHLESVTVSGRKRGKKSKILSASTPTLTGVAGDVPMSMDAYEAPAPSVPTTMYETEPASKESSIREDGLATKVDMDMGRPPEPGEEEDEEELPDAGLLTAGEWNDLSNWDFWKENLKEKDFEGMPEKWSFYPTARFSTIIETMDGKPITDCLVTLESKSGDKIWEARTDNTGTVEMWANLFSQKEENYTLKATVLGEEKSMTAKAYEEGINILKFQASCVSPSKADIMFVVDATGSMGDEIAYLKSELQNVIKRVKSENDGLELRLGSVFYRDEGDEYVTKTTNLSEKTERTVSFIQDQHAGGGGNYPEAVHSALEDAVNGQAWTEDAITRIIFLVLDAPPHNNEESIASLQNSIEIAAAKGIKIIPITASGVNKETEFLMKSFSVATNGTYVFITDHSGIGKSHIEATTEDFEVEYLNDVMVRLINANCVNPCEEMRQIQDPVSGLRGDEELVQQVGFHPNPASSDLYIELQEAIDVVTVTDSKGRVVRTLDNPSDGQIKMDVSDLAGGVYFIKFVKGDKVVTGKVVVVRA